MRCGPDQQKNPATCHETSSLCATIRERRLLYDRIRNRSGRLRSSLETGTFISGARCPLFVSAGPPSITHDLCLDASTLILGTSNDSQQELLQCALYQLRVLRVAHHGPAPFSSVFLRQISQPREEADGHTQVAGQHLRVRSRERRSAHHTAVGWTTSSPLFHLASGNGSTSSPKLVCVLFARPMTGHFKPSWVSRTGEPR